MGKPFDFVHQNVVIKIPIGLFLSLPLTAYLLWEYYWFRHVGLSFIQWHTHMALYIYGWIAGSACLAAFTRNFSSGRTQKVFLIFTALLFSLLLAEIFLSISGQLFTQTEKDSGVYKSPYLASDKTHYHLWPATQKEHWLTKPEFSFWRPTNSKGLPDTEWPIDKKKKEKRLLAMGDSFTEGDGAPNDSSYVSLLRQKLAALDTNFSVFNAGVCGSDPFNNYVVLRDCLLVYKPDRLLLAIGTNDMNTDIAVRGGMERFQKDGSVKYFAAPWWEPVYALSYVSRVFFRLAGYNELLIKKAMNKEDQEKINEQTIDLFRQYAALCRQHKIQLALILRPDKYEVKENRYSYDFSPLLGQLSKDSTVKVIDLLPTYRSYLYKKQADPMAYYWMLDGHHNPLGYGMMAQTIFENLAPWLTDSTEAKIR